MASGTDSLRVTARTSRLVVPPDPQQLQNPGHQEVPESKMPLKVSRFPRLVPSCGYYFGKLCRPASRTWLEEADHLVWVPGTSLHASWAGFEVDSHKVTCSCHHVCVSTRNQPQVKLSRTPLTNTFLFKGFQLSILSVIQK